MQSALELLNTIESKGFALTLEEKGTAQKWVTGKNLFMGLVDPNGLLVRNAYGPVAMEMPLRVSSRLNWQTDTGSIAANASEALRNTVKHGLVRRSSHLHSAMLALSSLCK